VTASDDLVSDLARGPAQPDAAEIGSAIAADTGDTVTTHAAVRTEIVDSAFTVRVIQRRGSLHRDRQQHRCTKQCFPESAPEMGERRHRRDDRQQAIFFEIDTGSHMAIATAQDESRAEERIWSVTGNTEARASLCAN
jgi:hypothetical protein